MRRHELVQVRTVLPIDGVVKIRAHRTQVDDCDHQKIHAHNQVGDGQVTHEKLRNAHREATADEHDDDGQVARQRQQHDQPDADAQ